VEHSGTRGTDSAETYCAMTGWWFGTMELYDFPYIGKNNPYFSIFFHIFPYIWNMFLYFGTDELHHFSEG